MRDAFRKRDGQSEGIAETDLRICHGKTGELGRLVISGEFVGLLDGLRHARRQKRRKPEADVDGPLDAVLKGFIARPHQRLEGADQIADDIFRRIVKEGGEAEFRVEVRLQG